MSPDRVIETEEFYANGILSDTGLPLSCLPGSAAAAARRNPPAAAESNLAKAKVEDAEVSFGPVGEVEPNDLAESGWGVVFHADTPREIKDALAPLIEHRRQQARDLCRVFENADGYRAGDTCTQWLARHGTSMNVVEPLIVPFYLTLVGGPEEIPFEFQYQLDIYWAVGRLHFDEVADYRAYAESVVAYEKAAKPPGTRSAAIFSTSHDFDKATQMFTNGVATALVRGEGVRGPLGERQKFRLEPFVGPTASKENLSRLLSGKSAGGPPALLLTGSHGMVFHPDDPRQAQSQGALVCQDWAGYGEIEESQYFAAADLPTDAQVHGLIHFFFACYGAGWPQFDDFPDQADAQPGQISPKPLMARLPQKLLAHRNGGALAALGHVDRAWSLSFHSAKVTQAQGFRDVMGRILRGDRIGFATDQFDVRRAALAFELADMLGEISRGRVVSDRILARLWIARNDARNYIILGDPAVRLRVQDIEERPA